MKAAIRILLVLCSAFSWPDHASGAGSADPVVAGRILHSSNGDGEIWPCG